jgi:transposase
MSRKNRFIEKLTEVQKSALEKGYRRGKSHLYRRKCHCILLSHEKNAVKELATLFKVSEHSIYKWLSLWEKNGVKALQLQPGRGRPPKLKSTDEEQVKQVKTLVENEPKNLNRVVGQIKSKMNIDLSKKTLQRFLKNLNIYENASAEG